MGGYETPASTRYKQKSDEGEEYHHESLNEVGPYNGAQASESNIGDDENCNERCSENIGDSNEGMKRVPAGYGLYRYIGQGEYDHDEGKELLQKG